MIFQPDYIEKYLIKYAPEHLNGYQEGWLHFDEIEFGDHKIIHVFSEENQERELVGTITKW